MQNLPSNFSGTAQATGFWFLPIVTGLPFLTEQEKQMKA